MKLIPVYLLALGLFLNVFAWFIPGVNPIDLVLHISGALLVGYPAMDVWDEVK